MTETERLLEKIARAWADQEPVDWRAAEHSAGLSASQIEQLRALDEVTQALRRVQRNADDMPRAPPLFHWGPLEVQASLGEGTQAEIYRAYDPVLAQAVALKLLRGNTIHASSLSQQLQEVRGLAKVRHRNVLSIYGAAEHDGRFGIWTELVDGVTLEQQLASDGPLSIDDALALGRDLLHALMTVHAHGLVHGDVKTGNVLRERGGRIVLADFGSCRLQHDAHTLGSVSGTHHYLPPETLHGSDAGNAGDTYAVAVLLYRVLSGHYPYAANNLGELMQTQRAGPPQPLLHWRPDAPEELSRLLSRALAHDPAQRLTQPAELLDALGTIARARHPVVGTRTGFARRLLASVIVLTAITIGLWWWQAQTPAGDIALGDITMEFARENQGQLEALTANSTLRTGDLLALPLTLPKVSFLYIFNEDAGGQVSALFPLPDLDRHNPLPAATMELPGTLRGQPFRWRVSSAASSEEFLVVIAPFALAELDPAGTTAIQPVVSATASPQRGIAELQRSQALPHFNGAGLSTLADRLAKRADAGLLQIRRFQFAQHD